MRTVRGILIDPFACTVTEVEHNADDYTDVYRLLSHESMKVGMMEAVYSRTLAAGDVAFVDEEGLLKPCDRFFMISDHMYPLAGKGLILGSDDQGETQSAKTPIDQINVMFLENYGSDLKVVATPWVKPESFDYQGLKR